MSSKPKDAAPEPVEPLLCVVRGERAILDTDLARLYGVETKALNRAVKHNADRFPSDLVFQLTLQGKAKGGLKRIVADHPFLLLILDRGSGSILFLGRVVDPR